MNIHLTSALLLLANVAVAGAAATGLETRVAEYREIPREYRLDGTVEAVNRSTLSAQTRGQVEAILYDVDDFVEKGAVVMRLRDTEQRAGLSRARAELKSATARFEEARDEHRRTSGIFEKGLVAQAAMDKADASLKSASAAREAALAALNQARERLEYTLVRAPYSGIVTRRFVEPGEIAAPGQPLVEGLSLERLRVNVDVPQSLVPAIRRQGEAMVEQPGNGYIPAEKITIYPFAQSASNTFRVRLDLPEGTANMVPGMFVKSRFPVGTRRLLMIPGSAVVYRSEVTGTYVLAGDKLHFRHIRLGVEAGEYVSVLSGLEEGERVALDPISAGALLKRQRAE